MHLAFKNNFATFRQILANCSMRAKKNVRKNVILEQCKGVHCVDVGESFQTHIYLQNLVRRFSQISEVLKSFLESFLVDLEKRCKMTIHLQRSVPIQPRTSLLKFEDHRFCRSQFRSHADRLVHVEYVVSCFWISRD